MLGYERIRTSIIDFAVLLTVYLPDIINNFPFHHTILVR